MYEETRLRTMVLFQLGAILPIEDTLLPNCSGFVVCQKSRMLMIDMFPFFLLKGNKGLHPALQPQSTQRNVLTINSA